MLTLELMRRMWPHAPSAKITAIVTTHEAVFEEFGLPMDPKVVAQFMANVSHENGAGTIVRENGNYSEQRLLQIFGIGKSSAAVSPEEAPLLAHRPQALFERVYNLPFSPKLAKELGNYKPGDGYKCRGGGDLQLTGRGSYERIGKITGHPEIADNPDLLADPTISFKVAVAEFVALGCVKPASLRQTSVVRRKVNGGTNGLSEVTVWVRRWEEVLPHIDAEPVAPRGADTSNKSLMSSKIMQGATATAGSLGTAAVSTIAKNANSTSQTVDISSIADKVQQASDTVTTIQSTADSAKVVVHTVAPFLGLAPGTWSLIAAIAITAGVCAIAFTMWERWKKLRDQGV